MRRGWRTRWRAARHTLSARLVVLFLLLALGMTLIVGLGMRAGFRGGWQDLARPLIGDYLDRLAAEIGTPPDVGRARALAARLPLRIRIDGPTVNWSSAPEGPYSSGSGMFTRLLADGHRIHFGVPRLARDGAADDAARLIGTLTLAALLLLVLVVYLLVRRMLAPLAVIRAGAVRYGAGNFTQPIETTAKDELGSLARQVNGMADGLRGLLDAKRQLLLAISHELRSPLTRARVNAELVDAGAHRDALLRDLAQMRDLVTDLLESERLSAGHEALHPEVGDVNKLIAEVVEAQFPASSVQLLLGAGLPRIPVDTARLRLLLRNLVDNALRHGGQVAVTITTGLEGGELWIRIRDHGPGVEASHLPHLTEAFYRPDAARQRSTGGVGLGLHLCRLVAEAHGGSFTLRNADPGLQAEVRLPL